MSDRRAVSGVLVLAIVLAACSPALRTPGPDPSAAPSPASRPASPSVARSSPRPTPSPSRLPASSPASSPAGPSPSSWDQATLGRSRTWPPALIEVFGGLALVANTDCAPKEKPRVWLTDDGTDWRRAEGVPGCFLASDGTATGALSISCERWAGPSEMRHCRDSTIWHTADGRRWKRATVAGLPTETTVFTDIAAIDGVMVALADDAAGDEFSCERTPQFAFRSTDGMDWTRIKGLPGSIPKRSWAVFTEVIGTSRGFVVGGSVVKPRCAASTQALWTSPDGLAWTDAATLPSGADEGVTAAAAGPGGYVATGPPSIDGDWGGWASRDGRTWTPFPVPGVLGGLTATAFDGVLRVGDGYLGHGSACIPCTVDETCEDPPPEPSCGIVFWRSPDGVTWEPVGTPAPCTTSMAGLVGIVGDRLVIADVTEDDDLVVCSAPIGP